MKPRNLLPLLLLLISAPAWSAPTVSMNWGSCTGPINQVNTGAHNYSLYVSVIGIDQPHQAYQVDIGFATADNTTPDAWLYDVSDYGELAVSPPAVSILPESQLSQVCPALSGSHRGLFISTVRLRPAFDTTLPAGTMQAMVAIAYDRVDTFDPGQRYFIARIDFDHSTSVEGEGVPGTSRGGFDQPMLFRFQGTKTVFLGLDINTELPFDSGNGEVLATFGGSAASTPATATTWGQIKSQYRR